MPANGRWDLIRRLKVNVSLVTAIERRLEAAPRIREVVYSRWSSKRGTVSSKVYCFTGPSREMAYKTL